MYVLHDIFPVVYGIRWQITENLTWSNSGNWTQPIVHILNVLYQYDWSSFNINPMILWCDTNIGRYALSINIGRYA